MIPRPDWTTEQITCDSLCAIPLSALARAKSYTNLVQVSDVGEPTLEILLQDIVHISKKEL